MPREGMARQWQLTQGPGLGETECRCTRSNLLGGSVHPRHGILTGAVRQGDPGAVLCTLPTPWSGCSAGQWSTLHKGIGGAVRPARTSWLAPPAAGLALAVGPRALRLVHFGGDVSSGDSSAFARVLSVTLLDYESLHEVRIHPARFPRPRHGIAH